ncbi:PASTA domain-containing protein [Deinococcus sp.]|uniref:PASTA domain-containing protein n=1 Tax=Deinococcus sp. TaxID=47478 RepID=UPI003CC66E87
MNIMSLAMNMMVARGAGIDDPGEQVRLGLVGAVAGGPIGVVLTSQMARNELDNLPPAAQTKPPTVQPLPGTGTSAGGPTLVEVPRVLRQPAERASQTLRQLGLLVEMRSAFPAHDEPKDSVLEQHNKDGSLNSIVPLGSTVVLTLSSGPESEPVAEPTPRDLSRQVERVETLLEREHAQEERQAGYLAERVGELEAQMAALQASSQSQAEQNTARHAELLKVLATLKGQETPDPKAEGGPGKAK